MQAWVVHTPGPVEALRLLDWPAPTPSPGRVLIDVRARGLNRSELYTRQGHSGDAVPFPRVLGIEAVGTVVDAGGTDLAVGDTVAAAMGRMGRAFDGSYAELVSVGRDHVYPIRTELDWPTFAALPETYLTAWGVIDTVTPAPGRPVLVRGGTSSVGLAAISILSDMGAGVVATTRTEAKRPALLEAGADAVLIDDGAVGAEAADIIGEPMDAVIELVGSPDSIADSALALGPGGAIGHVGMLADAWDWMDEGLDTEVDLRFYSSETLHTRTATPALQQIVDRVEAGRYRPNLWRVFEFGDLADAHDVMEHSRAAGKLVVASPRR